jgi:hypothetical protein
LAIRTLSREPEALNFRQRRSAGDALNATVEHCGVLDGFEDLLLALLPLPRRGALFGRQLLL